MPHAADDISALDWPQEKPVNAPPDQRPTGRIACQRIRMLTTPAPPAGAVVHCKAIGDPAGAICEAMDELGLPASVIGALET